MEGLPNLDPDAIDALGKVKSNKTQFQFQKGKRFSTQKDQINIMDEKRTGLEEKETSARILERF